MATIEYWVDMAEYDLITARAMLKAKRFLYVGFMCYQCIEKVLKGYCVSRGMNSPPYTHNHLTLANKGGLINQLSDKQLDFLDFIKPLNIEARYPKAKQKLLDVLTEKICKEVYTQTEEFFTWVKTKL